MLFYMSGETFQCRNELNGALMNGSRVRGGEGRFITFVFFFIDKKGDSIENNKIKGYKSTLTLDPYLIIKR